MLKELSEHFYFQSTSSHSFYDGSGESPGSNDLQFWAKNSKVHCLSDLEAFCLQADTMFHGILENDFARAGVCFIMCKKATIRNLRANKDPL